MIVFAAILAIILLITMVVIMSSVGGYGKKPKYKTLRSGAISIDKSEAKRKWDEIKATAAMGGAAQLKSSVIDADKLTEKVLSSLGFSGSTFAEKLKSARRKFPNYSDYDNLWYAHKVRNGIAHDNGADFSANNAKKAIGYFEKALKILGVL